MCAAKTLGPLSVRAASRSDAWAIATIYNHGIEDRVATFETEARSESDVLRWFNDGLPKVVVEAGGEVVAFAAAFPYSDRCCYGGVAEFSVYTHRDHRGQGAGKAAMEALIAASREAGSHKLLSRIFPENVASLGLMRSLGFREVGLHQNHGKLEGGWKDCMCVEFVIKENL